jgi:hypothetical protein
MSYDLMVFKKESAPKKREEFMQWYELQTQWKEEHSYDDPANTSPDLANWFMDMIQTFPAMNGPFAKPVEDDDDDNEEFFYFTDYSIGKDVIYAGFSWSLVEQAYETSIKLAEKHSVGFFDASGDSGDVFFPEGFLLPSDTFDQKSDTITFEESKTNKQNTKPWWKFW